MLFDSFIEVSLSSVNGHVDDTVKGYFVWGVLICYVKAGCTS